MSDGCSDHFLLSELPCLLFDALVFFILVFRAPTFLLRVDGVGTAWASGINLIMRFERSMVLRVACADVRRVELALPRC